MTLDWAIYYDDETVYTNETGAPHRAPKRGVQAIARRDARVGVKFLTGHDYYWREADTWFGGDRFGLFDYLSSSGHKLVFFGRSMTDAAYRDLLDRVRDDAFPEKSAFDSTERRVPR